LKEAQKNNPDLLSATQQLKQAEGNKGIKQSELLPQISTDLNAKKTQAASSGKEANTYSYAITGKQLLFDGFKVHNDIAAEKENIKASEYNYAVTSSNVRLNLRVAFSQLLKAQEFIFLTESIAERRKQNLELVKLRYEAGREHKGAFLTAQANLAEAEFEVEQARRNLSLAQTTLAKVIGWSKLVTIKVKGSFIVVDSAPEEPNFEYLVENTPLLKELVAKKEAARLGFKSAKADFFPQVYANTSFGKTAAHWSPDREEWMAGLSLSLPIFEGGSRIATAVREKAKWEQAKADQRSGYDSIIVALQETWVDLQDGIDNVKVKNKFLEANQERARIANSQYSSGLINFDDWVIIEDNLVSAKKAYLNAQADALIAEAKWIQAKGGLLEDAKK
ncbi:MAG: TolC family protein, partial [Candidatus Omnitrophica bacterium]|nr:TolC family protein [Candidatus Omnitrophota bacterium]